jgi:hypothetical protein
MWGICLENGTAVGVSKTPEQGGQSRSTADMNAALADLLVGSQLCYLLSEFRLNHRILAVCLHTCFKACM